ncbi:tautomerase family protein [Polaromonas sp. YR568]|uniref:tautomerase family protein n=1 Tax=Polaromonas sp. YR568 TaxID=1855301 RepID=UPI003137FF04
MPYVRIELPPTIAPERAHPIGDAVHDAMVETIAVPVDDKFQLITRHPPGAIVCTPEYLGVKHTAQALFIQIFLAPGRTLQQKRALYAMIARDVSAAAQVGPSDVLISLVETLRENWSFGDGVAHYTL